jgi:hypothetical protein
LVVTDAGIRGLLLSEKKRCLLSSYKLLFKKSIETEPLHKEEKGESLMSCDAKTLIRKQNSLE